MAKKQNPEHKWIVGTWYMNPMGYTINYQRGDHAYGFQNGWKNDIRVTPQYLEDEGFVEAPKSHIKTMLIGEAKKRGYDFGVTYKQIHQKTDVVINTKPFVFEFEFLTNSLSLKNSGASYLIYDSGKWAEIVGAEKELNFKVGESYKDPDGDIFKIDSIAPNDNEVYVTKSGTDLQHYLSIDEVAQYIDGGIWVKTEQEKPKIEVGKWYIGNVDGVVGGLGLGSIRDFLIKVKKVRHVDTDGGGYNQIYYDIFINHGINGNYQEGQYVANKSYEASMVLATEKQIREYLVAQAEKRGFKEGNSVFITKVGDFIVPKNERGWHYLMTTDELNYDGDRYTVYSDNHWWFNLSKEQPKIEVPDEYMLSTQEELKTLLKAYTYLAENGNEEAKAEILIIQKLIK